MSRETWIEFAHRRVGTIRLPASAVIRFAGLPGFPDARRFALVEHDQESPFAWLACLDDPDLAFVVTDPRAFFPGYAPEIPRGALEAVGAAAPDQTGLLVIVNLRGEEPRFNLAAPLVLHAGTRDAVQAVLDDPGLSISQPLPAPEPNRGPEAQTESKPQT